MDDEPTLLSAVAPAISRVEALISFVEGLREEYGYAPSPDSVGANELLREGELAEDWGPTPVAYAQSVVAALVAAAEGHIRSLITVMRDDSVVASPFSVDVLARSAIENLARATWRAEPALGRDLRVLRLQTERIYSAHEEMKLADEFKARAQERISRILASGERLGFKRRPSAKGRPARFVERRTATQLCADLYLDNQRNNLGSFLYRLLSATDHGTMYGLFRRIHGVDDTPDSGATLAGIITTSEEIDLVLQMLAIAYVNLMDRWLSYLGWIPSAEWTRVRANSLRGLAS